jgi:signal transduction histidine kinase
MILGVSFFIFIASFMTTADWVSQSSALIIMLGTSLLILAGILSHYAGHQSAKFFVLAFGTLCAGAFMSGLRSFDLIPTNMITANSVQLSSAIEMLLLSFALAHRIKVEKEEKEKTQHLLVQTLQKSETLLEQKVAKRTNELKQSLRKEQDTLEKFIRFGSYISHEFRNPLAIIKNQLSTLKKELSLNINENIDKRIETVLTATNRINDLFEGWLHSDRLRQGLTILSITRIDVYDFVSSIAQQCQSLYPDRSIYYESFDQPCYIDVDEDMIRLAIINLIDNAVKYSPQNKPIQIALLLKPDKIGIMLEDQGVGIRTEDIPNLFQDYFRLDNDKNIKGVGLGLAFVHKVCELHNSSIEVTSELGKGSRFCIWVNKDNAE